MHTRHYSLKLFSTLLLCLLGPITAAYGIKVRGLSIAKINPSNSQKATITASTGDTADRLDELLEGYSFPEALIDSGVPIIFPEEDTSTQSDDSELTDTDTEGKNANDQEAKNKWALFALNSAPSEPTSRERYLLRKNEINEDNNSFTKHLCGKLAADAFRIANAHKHARTRESTTCLCVVLRDKDERAKKFVFHNGPDKMQKSMYNEALNLGYAARTGYQAHAEGEFMQFLLHRMQQNSERYTHILGMGCSRLHCKECDCLLKLFLGANYYEFTAAMRTVGDHSLPNIANVENGRVRIQTTMHYESVYQITAVNNRSGKSPRYYLPRVLLQEHIKNKTGINFDFSSSRFLHKDEDAMMERRDKKRKANTSSPGHQE